MIGIGKWTGYVNSKVFKGDVTFEIVDNNGEYGIDFQLPAGLPASFKDVKLEFTDIHEDGNALRGKCSVSLLKGKSFDAEIVFEDDGSMHAIIKLGIMGSLKIQDGHRI